jgi:hypothetical protein
MWGVSDRVSGLRIRVQSRATEAGIAFGLQGADGMVAEKILGTSCIGFLVAVMSAMNDEFRHKLVTLANGGLWEEASVHAASTLRWSQGVMDSVNTHGGDNAWLLVTAMVGAVVGATWFMKW